MIKDKALSYWRDDSNIIYCEACFKKFGVFDRRHHCRDCGGVFCNKCMSHCKLPHRGFNRPTRVCNFCLKFVQTRILDKDDLILRPVTDTVQMAYTMRYAPQKIDDDMVKRCNHAYKTLERYLLHVETDEVCDAPTQIFRHHPQEKSHETEIAPKRFVPLRLVALLEPAIVQPVSHAFPTPVLQDVVAALGSQGAPLTNMSTIAATGAMTRLKDALKAVSDIVVEPRKEAFAGIASYYE